jgi:hypothetical protein
MLKLGPVQHGLRQVGDVADWTLPDGPDGMDAQPARATEIENSAMRTISCFTEDSKKQKIMTPRRRSGLASEPPAAAGSGKMPGMLAQMTVLQRFSKGRWSDCAGFGS